MMVLPSPESGFIADLRDELAVEADRSLGVVDVSHQSMHELIEQIATQEADVILIHGFEKWKEGMFASLDINRSRLEVGKFLLLCVNMLTAGRFLDNAPNIRSYLGANIFSAAPDPAEMSPQAINDRLNQLRTFYNLSDSEVLDQAERNVLSSDPHFVEWLVLLGRSDLAR